ncbi:MAG: AAA family ATPase [Pseudomonadota bacterium]
MSDTAMDLDALKEILTRARGEVSRVIIGQEEVIEQCLIAIFTGSHALIEGVPGVAKTLLVRTLSRVLGSEFSRIQFTPDLMPTDITGTHIFDLATGRFSLVRGPVFTPSSWPMRSTGPRPRPSRRFWRPCRNAR